MTRVKSKCESCGVIAHHWDLKKCLCFRCSIKYRTKMCNFVTLEQAQKRIRTVSVTGKNKLRFSINLPVCYFGKKVRVVVVDESKS